MHPLYLDYLNKLKNRAENVQVFWAVVCHHDLERCIRSIDPAVMLIAVFFACLVQCALAGYGINGTQYPDTNRGYGPCTENIFSENGMINLEVMMYACSQNIQSADMNPSYYPYDVNVSANFSGFYAPLNVSVGIALNSMVLVEDVSTQVKISFWYRNFWNDPRWYMPDMWQHLNPTCALEGLDITPYIRNSNEMDIYLPDIYWYQDIESTTIVEVVRLYPNGGLFWSRQTITTLTEGQMDLHKFPIDTQTFTLTFQSYSMSAAFLVLKLLPESVAKNLDSYNNEYFINLNQVWTFESANSEAVAIPSPVWYDPNRHYANAYINLVFKRQSYGVIYRLAVPIAIFLVIAACSFWAEPSSRINIALNMLLVTAALYLIIGQVIPFVGYLTTMDMFISAAFLICGAIIGIHLVLAHLEKKASTNPLADWAHHFAQDLFRVFMVPFMIYLLLAVFSMNEPFWWVIFGITIAISLALGISKYPRLRKKRKRAILLLREKEQRVLAFTKEEKLLNKLHLTKAERLVLRLTNSWYVGAQLEWAQEAEVAAGVYSNSNRADLSMGGMEGGIAMATVVDSKKVNPMHS